MCFFETDAIASSGGTTINYIDTYTNTTITVSNIINILPLWNSSIRDYYYSAIPMIYERSLRIVVFYPGGEGYNQNVQYPIRVFYY